ncbi:unnamed protein product [Symbiodinium natans]|uniref:Uncharacterized protein n=1 Tax=Symbiodinium natans TaxID=878477 RepID=A0A812QI04_9DINO|nr:unnamed protein product [Symbiodinium natans]
MGQAVLLDAHSQITLRTASATMTSLGQRLLLDYNSRLDKDGFESRCILLQSQLDLSADQRVALPEFLAGAPRILLPDSELRAEAVFFEACSKAMRLQRKAQLYTNPSGGSSDEDDEGICVQQ